MGIPVTISKEVIARAIRRDAEGSYEEGLEGKTNPWNEVVNMTMFNSTKRGKYCDMRMEHKLLQKIMSKNLLPKGGGVDQPSLDDIVFLHFLIKLEKANVPKYIFNHMLWAPKESQNSNKSWIPYGRLLYEIFHQGGILKALKLSKVVNDEQPGTVTRKIIIVGTLRKMHMIKKEEFTKLKIGLQESFVVSNLMDDFPPICKQDPIDVQTNFILDHWERTGETIKIDDIPEQMYGGALLVARRESQRKRQLQKLMMMKKLLNQ